MAATIMQTREAARQTDEELFLAHRRDCDLAARDELVKRFMPFARKLALRYVRTTEPLADLVQVACIGLLNAIERFDPGRGKKFTAFAAPTIMGELKRYFRDKGWSMHVPRDLKERALTVSRQSERLSSKLGRSPTINELSEVLECTIEETIEAIDAAHNYHPTSLDAPVAHDDGESSPLADTLGREDDGFDLAEERQALAAGWRTLSDTERQVLGLRLLHGLTQREISQRIGYSQMHVSRLLRRSLGRLDVASPLAAPG